MDFLKQVGNILITEKELDILKKYQINVNEHSMIDEVLLLIDRFLADSYDLSDEEYEELDYVASCLNERKYYLGSPK